ncbi:MAG: undecaprenyl-diphosphatase UppP [Desulfobulbus propionicus]|nr:MAG: undecaprenyl-diphosphatase UppP [Desulfobulbus propionicus]
MELCKAILLGIVQGLTEFLPVSSSGHLVIGSQLLDFNDPGIAFEVLLHLGTLLAVVIAFRQDILMMVTALFSSRQARQQDETLQQAYQWNFFIILATLPTVFAGLFLKDHIEQIFGTILITYVMLAVTGTIMLLTRRLADRAGKITASKSVLIGVAQSMAIMPGLSRSGSTIFAGMLMGVQRETAARFSFIMSIPAILGAAVLKLSDLIATPPTQGEMVYLAGGTLASAVSGYFAILVLMRVVRKGQLHWFGYYCLLVSAIGIGWTLFHPS